MMAATLRDLFVADAAAIAGEPAAVALCAHTARRLGHSRMVLWALRQQAHRPIHLTMDQARGLYGYTRARREAWLDYLTTDAANDRDDADALAALAAGASGARMLGRGED